ncbi:hypothetical protein, partial [Bradyrhizobium sp.]|uniref:hypothetical protein n=1 Tax=Bradyrhizobium sp. TaxID=376 RepID=UPI003D1172F4
RGINVSQHCCLRNKSLIKGTSRQAVHSAHGLKAQAVAPLMTCRTHVRAGMHGVRRCQGMK